MSERKAKLTLKVGDRSVEFETGVDRVEVELHRLASELLGSGDRASGLMLKRASRALEGKSRLVSRSGLRRGMRYRLTRDGVEHCETLIPRLLPLL